MKLEPSKDMVTLQSQLEQENKSLRLQSDNYFEEWQKSDKKWKELKEYITHKREINPSSSQYINMVLFIQQLEEDID